MDAEAEEILDYRGVAADPARWHELRREGVTASEVAGVLGISPWVSPFALWHRKRGLLAEEPDDRRMSLGRHLEEYVADLFHERHPEYRVERTGLWRHRGRRWQLATPDRLLIPAGDCEHEDCVHEVIPLECKTDSVPDERWGPSGSDEIPVYYRAQLMWQMDTLGADSGFLACFFLLNQDLRIYYLERSEPECALMRERAGVFLDSEEPPPVDWTGSTRAALRELFPFAEEQEVTVPRGLVRQYQAACRNFTEAERRKKTAEHRLRLVMGDASRAVDARTGDLVATRVVYERKPHMVKGSTVDRLSPAKGKKENG